MRRNFPRPYTTTYLRVVVVGQLVALADSEITAILLVVLTGWVPSLSTPSVSRSLSMPFRLMLSPCFRSSQPRPLAMLHQFLAYLPGLPLRVPRRWWKVADSNRWLILGSSENFSLFQVAGLPHRYRLFPSLYGS